MPTRARTLPWILLAAWLYEGRPAFNLDHGTDFATSVDGVPVNLPSHGHGQGYTDLNFMIPELVERVESRLEGEPAGPDEGGFDDVHFHPVDPISFRAMLTARF